MHTSEIRFYITFLTSSLLVLFLLCYGGWMLVRRNRKTAAEKNQQYTREMELLEKERFRISGDLHDDIGPKLAITQNILLSLQGNDEWEAKLIKQATENLKEVNRNISITARNLRAGKLLRKGLYTALMEVAEQMKSVTGIHVQLDYDLKRKLPDPVNLQLFRIIQEILGNALKHSKASYIDVMLKEVNEVLVLKIKDNGVGFIVDASEPQGLGMENIRYRTTVLNGTLELASNIGQGTSYLIKIPLQKYKTSETPM